MNIYFSAVYYKIVEGDRYNLYSMYYGFSKKLFDN